MAGERTLNFGADETDARWQMEDAGDGGNFVLARDLDGSVVLLEYDSGNSEWVSRGPVNMSGNDLSNVGQIDATALSTDTTSIDQLAAQLLKRSDQTISNNTLTKVTFDSAGLQSQDVLTVDTTNNKIVVDDGGTYLIHAQCRWADPTQDVRVKAQISINGGELRQSFNESLFDGASREQIQTAPAVDTLSQGDEIEFFVEQQGSGDETIDGRNDNTHLTVIRLG